MNPTNSQVCVCVGGEEQIRHTWSHHLYLPSPPLKFLRFPESLTQKCNLATARAMTTEAAMSQNPSRVFTNHIVHWEAFRTFLDFVTLDFSLRATIRQTAPGKEENWFCLTQSYCPEWASTRAGRQATKIFKIKQSHFLPPCLSLAKATKTSPSWSHSENRGWPRCAPASVFHC